MKSSIHPKYYPNAKVTCNCGETFETGSTLPEIKVEICSACHPFFTGEMRFVDSLGRVEQFELARKRAQEAQKSVNKKAQAIKDKQVADDYEPKTLKEMMQEVAKVQKTSTSDKKSE